MVNSHGDRKSPIPGVMGPLPNGRFMAYKWELLTILTSWDDPPSSQPAPPSNKAGYFLGGYIPRNLPNNPKKRGLFPLLHFFWDALKTKGPSIIMAI